MAEYKTVGKGLAFLNRNRNNSNQPNYSGDITINDEKMSVSMWAKTDKNGDTFYSLNIQETLESVSTEDTTEEDTELATADQLDLTID
jgi:hypothetical protein